MKQNGLEEQKWTEVPKVACVRAFFDINYIFMRKSLKILKKFNKGPPPPATKWGPSLFPFIAVNNSPFKVHRLNFHSNFFKNAQSMSKSTLHHEIIAIYNFDVSHSDFVGSQLR